MAIGRISVQTPSNAPERAIHPTLRELIAIIPPDSRMTLSAQLIEASAEVAFTVCGEGPGIAAEHLPYVLEQFYQADASRRRDTGGAGLGLAIVAEIAHAHGGRVDVESQSGHGACIRITLPHRW